jgi:hypothetical protein
MSEPAFTPGPWRVTRKYEVGPVSIEEDQSHGMVIPVADALGDNKRANAILIAEAPTLYAVAKAADEFVSAILEKRGEMNDAAYPAGLQALPLLKQIRAALGKVEGEGK